ncbi:MAG: HDIG domain-containing protein [Methanomicrobiales archaeon]|nr:HDIG domain-containing protein [Methanomicrobiales archaeon]
MPDSKRDQYAKLLRDAGCSAKVITHVNAVTDAALEYAKGYPAIHFSLVEQAAMLHDIGRGSTHAIDHAQRGADLLREKGFPEELARIVECHTGAGLTADECTLLGLLPRDCIPETAEAKIVTHADNLIAGHTRVSIHDSIGSAIHLPHKARKRMYRLALEVELLTGKRL